MKKKLFLLTMIGTLLFLIPPALSEEQQLKIQNLMSNQEFKSSGLNKLTPYELISLNQWLNNFTVEIIQLVKKKNTSVRKAPHYSTGPDEYEIEKAVNDEKFIINGELFEAQTYCIGWEEGDTVIFIEGSAFGACASAKLLNRRTGEICDVWCE